MNILFTSSGRRVELIKIAKEVVERFGGSIFCVDSDPSAPTSQFCNVFEKVPQISSAEYIPTLLDFCKRHKIDILIPLLDTELIPIAENVNSFKKLGVLVNISSVDVVKICRDKMLTQKFFCENSILNPSVKEDINVDNVKYPLFIKPIDGSSSVMSYKVNNARELEFFKTYVQKPIIQQFIEGDEYTIDVCCDFNSKPITVVPRQRISVRAGEIQKGKTVKDAEIINKAKDIVAKLKPYGHITIQCIKNKDGVFFTEINPRFGGGAPMSISAGANSIENLVRLKLGEELEYSENWQENMLFSRFDDAVVIK